MMMMSEEKSNDAPPPVKSLSRVDFNMKVALGSQKKHQENMKVTLDRAPWEKSDEN
jgi:hypothetical protein